MSEMADFFKLPAEIRAEIWRLVLITSVPIKITRSKNESPRRKWYDQYLLSSQVGTPGNKKQAVDFPSVSLIRTSKAINTEASPILYYNNRFIFDDMNVLETFFDKIGEMGFSVSDIEIKSIKAISQASKLSVLRRMHSPKRIILPVPIGGSRGQKLSASQVARDTWNWIKPTIARRGTEYMLMQPFRPHKFGRAFEGREGAWEYEPGSKAGQQQRVEAFHFVVGHDVMFISGGGKVMHPADRAARARLFKERVLRFWEMSRLWTR